MKKKNIAAVVAAAMICANAIPMAGAVIDGRNNLPTEFTTGKVSSVEAKNNIVAVIKDDNTLWISGSGYNTYFSPFTKVTDGVSSVSISTYGIGIVKNNGELWIAHIKDAADFSAYKKTLSNVRSANIVSDTLGLAVKNDNTLWGWGLDLNASVFPVNPSSLSSSNTSNDNWWEVTEVTKPTQMMTDVQKIVHVSTASLLLKTDDTVWVYGQGGHHFLGASDSEDFHRTPIKMIDNAKDIFGDANMCLVVKNDNTLWGWGTFPWSNTSVDTPTKIADNVSAADECGSSLIYTTIDGQMWSIGNNMRNSGGIGNNNELQSDTSNKTSLTNVKMIGCAPYISRGAAVKNDGSLWVWGYTDFESSVETPFYDIYNYSEDAANLYDFLQIAGPSSAAAAPTTPIVTPASTATAKPTNATVMVNGKQIAFDAYNINNNNYFKLRDIAKVLSGSDKQFEVTWNGSTKSIELKPGSAYTSVGGELVTGKAKQQTAKLSSDKVYMNGSVANLTAYTINGNNYFKLRDLGKLLNFGVDWDGTAKCISINSSTAYTE